MTLKERFHHHHHHLSVPATLALYDAILTIRCLRGLAPKYLSSRFNTRASVHRRKTRNTNKLYTQRLIQLLVSVLLYIERWNAGTRSLKKLPNVIAYTVLNLKVRVIFIQLLNELIIFFIIFIIVSYYLL